MQEAAKATSKEELQRLQGALDAAQQLTRDTQQQLTMQQSHSAGLQQQLQEQAERVRSLQQQLQTATGDTSTLQKELSKKVQKLDALQGEKNALQVRATKTAFLQLAAQPATAIHPSSALHLWPCPASLVCLPAAVLCCA
jgi:septal ring factor EnvC (AmiA/AmiB activator)